MKTRKFDIVNIKDINELRHSLYCIYIFSCILSSKKMCHGLSASIYIF